jgi:hypothetical protein
MSPPIREDLFRLLLSLSNHQQILARSKGRGDPLKLFRNACEISFSEERRLFAGGTISDSQWRSKEKKKAGSHLTF